MLLLGTSSLVVSPLPMLSASAGGVFRSGGGAGLGGGAVARSVAMRNEIMESALSFMNCRNGPGGTEVAGRTAESRNSANGACEERSPVRVSIGDGAAGGGGPAYRFFFCAFLSLVNQYIRIYC